MQTLDQFLTMDSKAYTIVTTFVRESGTSTLGNSTGGDDREAIAGRYKNEGIGTYTNRA